jgi:hypothetical protein
MIAGPRDLLVPISIVQRAVDNSGFDIDVHVNGMADGIDRCARRWATVNGLYIIPLEARWDFWRGRGNPRPAGPERNRIGSRIADALIVIKQHGIWTPGTTSVYRYFTGKPIHVENVDEGETI